MSNNRDTGAEFYNQSTSAIETKDIDAMTSPVEPHLNAAVQSGDAEGRDKWREAIRDEANGVEYTDVAFDIKRLVVLQDLF